MQATWDGNAHQLQNYNFLVIKVQEKRVLYGMLYLAIQARSHHVTTQFILQAMCSHSASRTNVCSGYFI